MFLTCRYCNMPLNTGIVTKEDFTACTASTVDTDIEITERPSDHKLVVRCTLAVMTVVQWTDYETMLPEHKRHPLILPKPPGLAVGANHTDAISISFVSPTIYRADTLCDFISLCVSLFEISLW